jgi:hypothetical protein
MDQKDFDKKQKEFENFYKQMEKQKRIFESGQLDNVLSEYSNIAFKMNKIKEEIAKFRKDKRINDK